MKGIVKLIIKNYLLILIIVSVSAGLSFAQESGQEVSKSNLKIFVQYRLAKADLLKNNNIQVDINGNKIILSGEVPTIFDKNQAEVEAHSVDENYLIVNNINVQAPSVADSNLTQQILNKIHNNVFYGIFDWFTVKSNNGVVTLDGWVHLPWLKNQYQTEVEKVPGVKKIVNNIQNTFGPGETGYRAARLIYNDPMFWGMQYFANPPIHIIVNNGKVFLFGTVSSEAQRAWAQNIVTFYTDAFSVNNHLQIKNQL
jgi:osmotically-inducible protein OsmY